MVLCAAFVACCARAADKTVTNKELGFEITFPEAWQAVETPPKARVFCIKAPNEAGCKGSSNVSVIRYEVKENEVLNDLVNEAKQGLKDDLKFFNVIEQIEFELAGVKAFKFIYVGEGTKTKDRFKISNYHLIKGTRGYIISAGGLEADFDKYAKDIDIIVKSFKLIDAK